MSFYYPLGLLGLLAIPLLIIIYIIKNKYTEQVISATYLWTLSEKFLKRRNPINRLTGIISLILQILAVILLSTALAHPSFVLKGRADDYLFILDGSGSMNTQAEENTRLQIAKGKIAEKIENSVNGSVYTLVYTADTTNVVYESLDDRETAIKLLNELEPAYCDSDVTDALTVAQEAFNQTPSTNVYLVTDKQYENVQNAEVIPVFDEAENYAVSHLDYEITGGTLKISGKAWSYHADAEVELKLYFDGEETASETQTLSAQKGKGTDFTFTRANANFRSVKAVVTNTDALPLDNESVLYYLKSESIYQTLIVSAQPIFMEAALTSFGNVQVKSVHPDDYAGETGYGLYVFDSYTPEVLPSDGAVWFINPTKSVSNTGFSVQGSVELDHPGEKLNYSTSTSSRIEELLEGTTKAEIAVIEYVKCGFYRSFHTLLSHEGNPVVFAGTNAFGNREVVFAFQMQNSDFTMSYDFIPLMRNLLGYTFPEIVSEAIYACGETVQINMLSNSTVRLVAPSGKVVYFDGGEVAEHILTEIGTYTVTMTAGSTRREVNIYSELPASERVSAIGSFLLTGEASEQNRDGKYDELVIFFILLAVIFVADWGIYCYEQYQLR